MDNLSLLRQARDAGLILTLDGDKLKARGPKAAEPVVRLLALHKPAIIALVAEAADWRARHREALAYWGALHPRDEAERLAWGELSDRWHRQHGERVPPDLCAGCRKPIGAREALDTMDGCRVHLDTLACLLRYGNRWHTAAAAALAALGLSQPSATEE